MILAWKVQKKVSTGISEKINPSFKLGVSSLVSLDLPYVVEDGDDDQREGEGCDAGEVVSVP